MATTTTRSYLEEDSLCSFSVLDEGQTKLNYNLCPLWNQVERKKLQVIIDEETPPTHTRYVYDIAAIGETLWDNTLPANLQCPKGTWICLTVINTRPDHPSEPQRILQVVPVANFEDSKLKATSLENSQVQVVLHGGKYLTKKQKALFLYQCQSAVEWEPHFLWNFNGTHAFSWKSKHACPSIEATRVPTVPAPSSTPIENPEPPDSPPKDPEEAEPSIPNQNTLFSRHMPLFYFLLVICLGLLFRRTRKLKSYPALKALRMRIVDSLRFVLPTKRNRPYQIVEEEMDVLDARYSSPEHDRRRLMKQKGNLPNYGL